MKKSDLPNCQAVIDALQFNLGFAGFTRDISKHVDFKPRKYIKMCVALELVTIDTKIDNVPGIVETHVLLTTAGRHRNAVYKAYMEKYNV